MRTWRWLAGVALVGVVSAAMCDPVRGQEKPKKGAEFYGLLMKDLITADEMAEYGRKNNAPEALVAAAGVLLKVHTYTGGSLATLDEPTNEKGEKVKDPGEEVPTFKQQAKDLIDEAEVMGEKTPGVAALIKAVKARDYTKTEQYKEFREYKKRKERSVAGGVPKRVSRKVQAGGTHQYPIRFEGGQPAAIVLKSNVPVRFVVTVPGLGKVVNTVGTTFRYTWTPENSGTSNVKVEVRGEAKAAQYTVLAN